MRTTRIISFHFVVLSVLFFYPFNSASAYWLELIKTPTVQMYLDPNTLKKDGHYFTVKILIQKPSEQSSLVTLWKFDCENQKEKVLSITKYSGKMGRGDVAARQGKGTWHPIVYNSAQYHLIQLYC